jgi:ABC-type uncharacterized transport system ATPase subunit
MITQDIKHLLPADFSPTSRVWIYQANRPFNERETIEINEQLDQFASQWLSHGARVAGWAKLLFNQVIVVMADESATGVSGCSTDSSVRIMKSLERQYEVNLFDRLLLGFVVNDKIQLLPLAQIGYAFEKGFINEDTLYLNNTVLTKEEMEKHWLIPVKDSWVMKKVQTA